MGTPNWPAAWAVEIDEATSRSNARIEIYRINGILDSHLVDAGFKSTGSSHGQPMLETM